MIDLHTHILPQMDDGSASLEESAQLLALLARQGVEALAVTSHFYASREYPEAFLARRAKALAQLNSLPCLPRVLPGAEVAYFSGMHRCDALTQLCIGDSRLLLLEMPFVPWTQRIVDEVLSLPRELGIVPVLAHVDRYGSSACMGRYRETLLGGGVLFQVNAEAFLGSFSARPALTMLKQGQCHFLGSDCHDLTSRPPQMDAAAAKIRKKLGDTVLEELQAQGRRLLGIG